MVKPYKLKQEIRQFIIEQKKDNPELSSRGLVPLIRARFQVSLSKSLINNVIKQNNLSGPVGRSRTKELSISKQPVEIKIVRKERVFIENGGCFFLKLANLKLGLTPMLADNISVYFPNLSLQNLLGVVEASIFMPLFKHKRSLWLFISKEIPLNSIEQYSKGLERIPLGELNQALMDSGFSHNINKINMLHKECLLQLSSYVQGNFFPPAYQFLEFPAMQERFYSLWAKIKRENRILEVQFFYPEDSVWKNDVVWHEDLAFAEDRVNESRIFTQEKEQIWINPKLEILPINLI